MIDLLACPAITLYTVTSIQKGNGLREPQSRQISCFSETTMV